MDYYAGIRRLFGSKSMCVSWTGRANIFREARVMSDPKALVDFFRRLEVRVTRIGLEAGRFVTMASTPD